ncbi:hypothetical protein [Streptomyces sp. NPDC090022]|uniref:hypothetical protein n=1 Tax=Streptomyces sp. NPDC090022 TaxID=3365920 RepID=UPI0037FF807E
MNNVRKRAGIAAGAALAGIALAFPAVAFADGPEVPARQHAGKGAEQRQERQKELAEALAQDLGVPVEKVTGSLEKFRAAQAEKHRKDAADGKGAPDRRSGPAGERPDAAALQKRLSERLDRAVEDGKLTRAQADAILAAVKSGVLPGPLGGRPHLQGR